MSTTRLLERVTAPSNSKRSATPLSARAGENRGNVYAPQGYLQNDLEGMVVRNAVRELLQGQRALHITAAPPTPAPESPATSTIETHAPTPLSGTNANSENEAKGG